MLGEFKIEDYYPDIECHISPEQYAGSNYFTSAAQGTIPHI